MNDINKDLNDFLERNLITQEIWNKANIGWDALQEIATHHEARLDHLKETAELLGKLIQKFNQVHSVRWRVKATDHVLEKIIRKRCEESEKYLDISVSNYFERITDLVGIRALHLFKDDCFEIDRDIKNLWTPIENPIAYIRIGDRDTLIAQFLAHGFEVKNHPAGYRSVHYVLASQPVKQRVVAEIQVRTIFEEGWSEIDHKIRYPNFTDNEQVDYILTIFNRMAGSADEMGGFVKDLTFTLNELEQEVLVAQQEKQSSVKAMEDALIQLQQVNQQGQDYQDSINKLKEEVSKLKLDAIRAVTTSDSKDKISGSLALASALERFGNKAVHDSASITRLTGGFDFGSVSPETQKILNRIDINKITSSVLKSLQQQGAAGTTISSDTLRALQRGQINTDTVSDATLKALQRSGFGSDTLTSNTNKDKKN